MKILFLGGTGNISADCAERLHGDGHEILVVTRGHRPVPAGYRAIVADRHNPGALLQGLENHWPDAVINFLGFEVADVQADFDLFAGRIAQYVFISSATVYAKPAARLPITEEAPLGNPWWDYARKKIDCENWLGAHGGKGRFPFTIVRPSHTYSRRWIPNVVSSSTYTLAARLERGLPVFVPDDGETPWTLTATEDFAVGLAGLIGHPGALGEAFHITSDEVLTWNRIYAEIAAAVGARDPQIHKIPTDFICSAAPHLTGTLKGDKAHPGVFDNTKLRRCVPSFGCRVPFREGIRRSIAWLRAHPEDQNLKPDVDQTVQTVVDRWKAEAVPGA